MNSQTMLAPLFLLAAAPVAAAPVPTAMPNDAIVKAWSGERPTFGVGRFSSDGSQLAFVASQLPDASDQAWLYNLKTKQLQPVSVSPTKTSYVEIRQMAWGADGALYVSGARDAKDRLGMINFQLTVKGGRAPPSQHFRKILRICSPQAKKSRPLSTTPLCETTRTQSSS